LRIIKRASFDRHTARTMEMKKMDALPPQQEMGSSIRRPVVLASSSTTPPPILSKYGILDLDAITSILQQDQETSSTSTSSTPQTEDTNQEPKSQQQHLEEEIERLNREEMEEDGWENAQGQIVKLSISHDGEYCVATALAAV
jgi:hypothetical protein